MIGKLLLLVLVVSVVYFIFFRNKVEKNINKDEDEETLIKCKKCSTYMSKKDAFVDGKEFYCSKECRLS